MNQILFLCTGNYYRSRYAEILFNHLAAPMGLRWKADSRGLNPDDRNPGPMSRHTVAALQAAGIPVAMPMRSPIVLTPAVLSAADLVVAVKEAEHRPLLERLFPEAVDRVEFWHVHDLDCAGPEEALPQLRGHVERLITRLADRQGTADSSTLMARSA